MFIDVLFSNARRGKQVNIKIQITGYALLAALLSGCFNDLQIKEHGALAPSAKFSYNLLSSEQSSKTEVLEADVAYIRGKSTIRLTDKEKTTFNVTQFNGPLAVDASYGLLNSMLGIRTGKIYKDSVGAEFLAGIDYLWTDLKLQSGTKSDSKNIDSFGPYFGGKLSYKPADYFTLYARFLMIVSLMSMDGSIFDGGASVRLHKNISMFAEWRNFSALIHTPMSESNIVVNISGPRVGVEVAF